MCWEAPYASHRSCAVLDPPFEVSPRTGRHLNLDRAAQPPERRCTMASLLTSSVAHQSNSARTTVATSHAWCRTSVVRLDVRHRAVGRLGNNWRGSRVNLAFTAFDRRAPGLSFAAADIVWRWVWHHIRKAWPTGNGGETAGNVSWCWGWSFENALAVRTPVLAAVSVQFCRAQTLPRKLDVVDVDDAVLNGAGH